MRIWPLVVGAISMTALVFSCGDGLTKHPPPAADQVVVDGLDGSTTPPVTPDGAVGTGGDGGGGTPADCTDNLRDASFDASCNNLSPNTAVMYEIAGGVAPPVQTGGIIADGTYRLLGVGLYNNGGGVNTGRAYRGRMKFSAGTVERRLTETNTCFVVQADLSYTATYTATGNKFKITESCGKHEDELEYTAGPTSLDFLYPATKQVLHYTKE